MFALSNALSKLFESISFQSRCHCIPDPPRYLILLLRKFISSLQILSLINAFEPKATPKQCFLQDSLTTPNQILMTVTPCKCYNYPTVSCQPGSHAFLCHVLLDISEKKFNLHIPRICREPYKLTVKMPRTSYKHNITDLPLNSSNEIKLGE